MLQCHERNHLILRGVSHHFATLLCGTQCATSCGLFYTGFYMLGPMLRGTRMSCACAVVGSTTLVSLGSLSSIPLPQSPSQSIHS